MTKITKTLEINEKTERILNNIHSLLFKKENINYSFDAILYMALEDFKNKREKEE